MDQRYIMLNEQDFDDALDGIDGSYVLNMEGEGYVINNIVQELAAKGYHKAYEPVEGFLVPAKSPEEAVRVFEDFLINYDQWGVAEPEQAAELIMASEPQSLAPHSV
jgi:hypothetical protein